MPQGDAEMLINTLAGRKLNRRDKAVQDQINSSIENPYADQATLANELSPGNIQELARAIDKQHDPKLKAILMQEMQTIRDHAKNLLGPVAPPPMLPGMIPQNEFQQPTYDPQSQKLERAPMTVPVFPPNPNQIYRDHPQNMRVDPRFIPNERPGGVTPPPYFGGTRG